MTTRAHLTPRAAEGLHRIVHSVAEQFGAAVAERVVDQLEHAFEQLAANPGIGHRRDDLTLEADVRFWSVGPTLIAFRVRQDRIEILCIELGQRDWVSLLRTHLG